MTNVINIADLREANGKTIRQNNLERKHTIATGRLVEVISSGLRLWVWGYGRDCDGTPLYHLTADQNLVGKEIDRDLFPTDLADRAQNLAPSLVFGSMTYDEAVTAAKLIVVANHGQDRGKIHWNYTSDEDLRVVDVHTVDEAKEREMFEAELNPHSRNRNEHGDYVLPSIQDRWAGWLERATKKEFTTLDTEMWKSPFISMEERLEIADGAVAWRNDVIANLRRQLTEVKQQLEEATKEEV